MSLAIQAGRIIPNHIATRYSRHEHFMDEVDALLLAKRTATLRQWHEENVQEGLYPPDAEFMPLEDGKPMASSPMSYIEAMLTIWPLHRPEWPGNRKIEVFRPK